MKHMIEVQVYDAKGVLVESASNEFAVVNGSRRAGRVGQKEIEDQVEACKAAHAIPPGGLMKVTVRSMVTIATRTVDSGFPALRAVAD